MERSIQEWLTNAMNGVFNQSILFVKTEDTEFQNTDILLKKLKSPNEKIQLNISVIKNDINRSSFRRFDPEKNNIFIKTKNLSLDNNRSNEEFQKVVRELYDKKILYIHIKIPFNVMIDKLIFQHEINDRSYIEHLAKISPIDLLDVIKNFSSEQILDFLTKDKYTRQNILSIDDSSKLILTQNEFNWLRDDINFLKSCNILTARLAVVLYRFAFLDINANHTLIGRYMFKLTGTRSKTINNTYLGLKKSFIPEDLRNKNFKAYDLSINHAEIKIREEIAKNLLELRLNKLDSITIAKITGLTENMIFNLKKRL